MAADKAARHASKVAKAEREKARVLRARQETLLRARREKEEQSRKLTEEKQWWDAHNKVSRGFRGTPAPLHRSRAFQF